MPKSTYSSDIGSRRLCLEIPHEYSNFDDMKEFCNINDFTLAIKWFSKKFPGYTSYFLKEGLLNEYIVIVGILTILAYIKCFSIIIYHIRIYQLNLNYI